MSVIAYIVLRKEYDTKVKVYYPFDEEDIKEINIKTFSILNVAGFIAGIISGVVGVGAGLILVSAMLLFKMNPRVSSATSGTMYFFISATSIIKTILSKTLTW